MIVTCLIAAMYSSYLYYRYVCFNCFFWTDIHQALLSQFFPFQENFTLQKCLPKAKIRHIHNSTERSPLWTIIWLTKLSVNYSKQKLRGSVNVSHKHHVLGGAFKLNKQPRFSLVDLVLNLVGWPLLSTLSTTLNNASF